jgi:hypothetical protein
VNELYASVIDCFGVGQTRNPDDNGQGVKIAYFSRTSIDYGIDLFAFSTRDVDYAATLGEARVYMASAADYIVVVCVLGARITITDAEGDVGLGGAELYQVEAVLKDQESGRRRHYNVGTPINDGSSVCGITVEAEMLANRRVVAVFHVTDYGVDNTDRSVTGYADSQILPPQGVGIQDMTFVLGRRSGEGPAQHVLEPYAEGVGLITTGGSQVGGSQVINQELFASNYGLRDKLTI